MKDEKISDTNKQEGCGKRGRPRLRGLCEERSKKGRGGSKVETESLKGAMEKITKVAVQRREN